MIRKEESVEEKLSTKSKILSVGEKKRRESVREYVRERKRRKENGESEKK